MNELLDNIVPLGITAAVLILAALIAVPICTPRLLLKWTQRKATEEEREAFPLRLQLLRCKELVEFYAPSRDFQRKLEDDQKKGKQFTWLSPFPTAVKAAQKRHKNDSKRVVTLVRQQVAEAAKHIQVATLPESEQPANAGPEHFSITLKLDGQPGEKVRAFASTLKSQLALESIMLKETDDHTSVTFHAHQVTPVDKLTSVKKGADFLDQNPVSPDLRRIPLAVKEDGTVYSLPTHHTLILGSTGSGKGSPLHAIIRQLAPAQQEGRVLLFGADPKNLEFPTYEESALFTRLAFSMAEIPSLIEEVYDLMMNRVSSLKVDLAKRDLKRSITYDKETPLVIFLIDELLFVLLELQAERGNAKYIKMLNQIGALGRAPGVFLVAATQEADKELLGRMRASFVNKIVLRQPSEYFNNLFLMEGEDAIAAGFDSTKIPLATGANGYRTAGIGFAKEDTGVPVRVRFAYSSDDDLIDLVLAYPTKSINRVAEGVDDDGAFGFEDILESDNGHDELGLPDLSELSLPDLNSNTNH